MEIIKDALFPLEAGGYECYGAVMQANKFVTEHQLYDRSLWSLFVKQFTYFSDDVDNGWRGEFWGKMMRGACEVYRFTADKKLYEIITDSVRELIKTRRPDGRICTYSEEKEYTFWDMWCRKYVMLGLEYYYGICEDAELKNEIINVLKGHADVILAHVGEEDGKLGINQTSSEFGALNSSSILEPFVRLYNLTGEKRYLDFASYIVACGGSNKDNIFERAYQKDGFPYQYSSTKAYEMMSCFEGLLEYYRVTGIEKYKTAVLNFIDMIKQTEITAIGSAGFTHELFDNSAVKQFVKSEDGILQETCVTVTWMKLCYQALRLTGDVKYASYIEHSALNGMLGSLNTSHANSAGGMVFDSYSPIFMQKRGNGMGGIRILELFRFFGCCAAIGAAGIGLSGIYAVMKNDCGIRLNSFIAGTYKTKIGAKDVVLRIETEYPKSPVVRILLEKGDTQVTVRNPKFNSGAVTLIHNGKQVDTSGETSVLEMKCGDSATLIADCTPYVVFPESYGVEKGKINMFSVFAGPLVLAQDSKLNGDIEETVSLPEKIVPLYGENLPEHEVAYRVITKEKTFDMLDYASCGKSWKQDSKITVWTPYNK